MQPVCVHVLDTKKKKKIHSVMCYHIKLIVILSSLIIKFIVSLALTKQIVN